jgi:hypothetical protein
MGVMWLWVEAILMRLVFGGCWVGSLLGFRVQGLGFREDYSFAAEGRAPWARQRRGGRLPKWPSCGRGSWSASTVRSPIGV